MNYNIYNLREIIEDEKRIHYLMHLTSIHAKKTITKQMLIQTPNKRRGNTELKTIQHYDLNSIIEHYEAKLKGSDRRFIKAWTKTLKVFKDLKLHMQREEIISALIEQFKMDEKWLRQFSKDELKDMLDRLLKGDTLI